MRLWFERLKRLGPITSSITIARLRVFTQPRPVAEVARCNLLRPQRPSKDVLGFRPEGVGDEAARVHHAFRRWRGSMVAGGARRVKDGCARRTAREWLCKVKRNLHRCI